MNKFAELAAKIRMGQAEMDQEADALSAEIDQTLTAFRAAAGQHRSMLNSAREGVQAMQEAASGLIGHNGAPPLEDTSNHSAGSAPNPPQQEAAAIGSAPASQ